MPDALQPYSIVVVCTGNICRSPAGERLIANALGPSVDVTSAGTHALRGHPIDGPMAELLAADGVDVSDFAARQLDSRILRGADLVLAMSAEHRDEALRVSPAAMRKVFTLREFARSVEAVAATAPLEPEASPAARLAVLAPKAARARRPEGDDDIADPFRRPAEAYQRAYREIHAAVAQIARALTPTA